MNINIDSLSATPAYLQLYEHLKEDIVKLAYPLGTKLPSKRIIASETGVSVITVEHALELLCDEGYVEARQRSGYFVIYQEADFQSAKTLMPTPILETSQTLHKKAEFPFSVMSKAMHKVMLDFGEDILNKSPNTGCEELKVQICAYLARSRGINVSPAQIVIGSGAEYLYSLIAQLLGTCNIFALENPSYNKIRQVYTAMGVKCEMLPLSKDGISTYDLTNTGARILHVTPFNSYPSGISVGVSKKREYLSWAKQRDGVIIEDNYDSELTVSTKAEDSLFSMAKGEGVIYINTFSKTVAPSIRMGYMILPVNFLEAYNQRLGFYSCTVPVFEQLVLAELLKSGAFERHINRIRRNKRKQS